MQANKPVEHQRIDSDSIQPKPEAQSLSNLPDLSKFGLSAPYPKTLINQATTVDSDNDIELVEIEISTKTNIEVASPKTEEKLDIDIDLSDIEDDQENNHINKPYRRAGFIFRKTPPKPLTPPKPPKSPKQVTPLDNRTFMEHFKSILITNYYNLDTKEFNGNPTDTSIRNRINAEICSYLFYLVIIGILILIASLFSRIYDFFAFGF